MPGFQPHTLDLAACRVQIDDLKKLLDGSADISEGDFGAFFVDRKHLLALAGFYNHWMAWPDQFAWEHVLFGDFRCDFVIGDSVRHAYTFVEYEDARPNSLFVQHGAKATRDWSPRFDGGYSQIIDWFYKLRNMTDSPEMEDRFGKRAIQYVGVLIIGRDQHMSVGEKSRLEWRREHVRVNSKTVLCVTFDQFCQDLQFWLDKHTQAGNAGG
jgi:hypothetical protein